ncbi:MAG: diguanylate cyclase domain-containing protein, partial [Pseudomonas sp.]
HDTQAARRAALSGWVVASLRINKLMASLYGERAGSAQIKIYDGVRMAEQSLLYDSTRVASISERARSEAVEYLEVAGRTWALELRAVPELDWPISKDSSRLISFAGIALSLLLTLLTWVLATGRSRALALAREMTQELRESETRLRHQAEHDALTGLPNRAMFGEHLTHALAQARRNKSRLALMFIDLDKFKPINDTLGHHVGDALLQVVAQRLQGCVRESDIVGRLGGDEFVVLLPAVESEHDALRVAEKIRESLNQSFELEGEPPLSISSSTGIALYPEHGSDEVQLVKNADAAMYQAKDGGRNRVQLYRTKVAEHLGKAGHTEH